MRFPTRNSDVDWRREGQDTLECAVEFPTFDGMRRVFVENGFPCVIAHEKIDPELTRIATFRA